MNKREILGALISAPISCLVVPGVVGAQQMPHKRDQSGRPFRSVNVAEDGRRVLFFFDFACPFCASYHEPLMTFSRTVPQTIQTMFVPVINVSDLARKDDQMVAAKVYYAALAAGTRPQINRFVAYVYRAYPSSQGLRDRSMWLAAVKDSGIEVKRFTEALNAPSGNAQLTNAARKLVQYDVRATPSVGVGGKYVISPDDVAGDQNMFFNILNGLTSEIL